MIHTRLPALAACLLLCLLGPTATAGDEAETTLLVKCEASDVEAVLEALADLDVAVYDLETMERLHAPPPPEQTLPPPLSDAAAVVHEVWRIVEAAGGKREGSEPPRVRLVHASVKERRVRLQLRAQDAAALDRIEADLARSATLEGRRRVGPSSIATQVRADGEVLVSQMDVRLEASRDGAAIEKKEGRDSLRAIVDAASAEAGVKWVAVSREYVEDHAQARTFRMRIDYGPTERERLAALLRLLSDTPGVVVTEVEWRTDPAHEGNELTKTRIEVSRQVREPR